MADKEATVYIVDIGRSMAHNRNGRKASDLEWAMQYVWDKITTTIATGRKNANAAVVALRSNVTKHNLNQEEAFEHIEVLKPLGQILMPDVRSLRHQIKPSDTEQGDAISALVVAIQLISRFCKTLKFRRNIVLITNGTGYIDDDGLEEIVSKIKQEGIQLVVLGADFDDHEAGYKEEDKNDQKMHNEKVLKELVVGCDGVFGSLNYAVSELGLPTLKSTRRMPSFKGNLLLGNCAEFESAISIAIERFPRTMVAKAPSSSNFAIKLDGESSNRPQNQPLEQQLREQEENGESDMALLRSNRVYHIKDDGAPGGKKDVDRDQLERGYEYGRTAVHISKSDETVIKFDAEPSLEILGFVPLSKFERYMALSRTNVIVAQRTNDLAGMALSSFIHTLYELESCAVARLVTNDDRGPVLILLSPSIESDFECLLDVELPFAEDVRSYKFPPLDRIVTLSGKIVTDHRNLPAQHLQEVMGDLVDSMDLSEYDKDVDGNPTEYLRAEDTFSPQLHRLDQATRFRAVHETDTIPPPSEYLTMYTHPPPRLMQRSKLHLDQLSKIADIKKVPPKTGPRKLHSEKKQHEQPRSGLDISALLAKRSSVQKTQISTDNAIPAFKQILATAHNVETVRDAVTQLGDIIRQWITHSFADIGYSRALEGLGVMRQECLELEEPGSYNAYLKDLKKSMKAEELGGDRSDMWRRMRSAKIGLIDSRAVSVSSVGEQEAEKFFLWHHAT